MGRRAPDGRGKMLFEAGKFGSAVNLYMRRDNAVIEYSFLYYPPMYFYDEESINFLSVLPVKSAFSVLLRLCSAGS